MKVPLLDLRAQYAGLREEIVPAIEELCESQMFILGAAVESFEKKMADYCGTSHAIGVSSGTDALVVSLMALGIGPGDGVITTPFTFFATAGSIVRLGAVPVLVDIDPVTFNIDPVQIEALLASPPDSLKDVNLKAIMPVHLYGQCVDMDPIIAVARKYNLAVVEDACQAIGAEYPGADGPRRAGAMGDFGCFSFFPSKNLGGFGDGGMVTTNDAELADKVVKLRNHGMHPKYYHAMIGGNFRLDALQAAVLEIKLAKLESWHEGRRKNAAHYDQRFAGSPVKSPAAVYKDKGVTNHHIYNQYVIRVPDRDAVVAHLRAEDIGCDIYYPVSLHEQECFKDLGYSKGDMPASEKASAEVMAIPIYPEMTTEMLDAVADAVLSKC